MSKKIDRALEAAMGTRKPAAAIEDDMASTVIGVEAQSMRNATPIPLDLVVDSPYQSRALSEAHVDHLVASIEAEGLLVPILVRPVSLEQGKRYELVAGQHRVAALRRLGRVEIPALVRQMSDAEAARALATENTARADLTDFELYKHMLMLRREGKVKSNTEMARLLNFSRTKVIFLESFSQLPPEALPLLEQQPGLLGYNVAYQLASTSLCLHHPVLVVQGIERLAAGKLQQSGLAEWVQRKAQGSEAAQRREVRLGQGSLEVRLATTRGGLSITSTVPLDFDKVKGLIEQHLDQLVAG